MNQRKKKVFFAMIEAGGGHKAPARAIMDALADRCPDRYELVLSDFMKDLGCVDLDTQHKESWNWMLKHPFLCTASFYLQETLIHISRHLVKLYPKPFVPYVEKWLEEYRPDVVVSTHFLNSYALIDARKRTNIPFTLITVTTDLFGVYSFWIVKGSDTIVVYTEGSRLKLLSHGMDKSKILVSRYPISDRFFDSKRDDEAVRSEIGLDSGAPTLLVSFGAQGAGDLEAYIDALIKTGYKMNVIVVAGKNAELKGILDARYSGGSGKIKIVCLGFVDNMNELISVSDYCFIKPGAATTMEAMYSRKPIIFYRAVSPTERWNIDWAVRQGIGYRVVTSRRLFVKAIRKLHDPKTIARIQVRYDALALSNGADEIADYIDSLATDNARAVTASIL